MIFFKQDPFKELKRSLGKEKCSTRPEDLMLYRSDATSLEGTPGAIVKVETVEDVQKVVKFGLTHHTPIVARGAGSGLSGGSVPLNGAIVVSFERMNRILKVDPKMMIAEVEPGVVTEEFQRAVKKMGLFYPPDPSSHSVSTLGGNVAENAGGLRCFKYGVTGHYVMGLEYVDGKGEIQRSGNYNSERSVPDWTPILVGSEGTLGLFTRIALRLLPHPPATETALFYFGEARDALEAAAEIVSSGTIPAVLEFVDQQALSAAAAYCQIVYPSRAKGVLLVECDGEPEEVLRDMNGIENLVQGAIVAKEKKPHKNILEEWRAKNPYESETIWKLRRSISPSLQRLSPDRIHEDIAVPKDRLVELWDEIQNIAEKHNLRIPTYGHAGDGNLHVVILYDKKKPTSREVARSASQEIFRLAIHLGGTITGEHGIGLSKRDFLPWQIPPASLNIHRMVKQLFDPYLILNPDKIISSS